MYDIPCNNWNIIYFVNEKSNFSLNCFNFWNNFDKSMSQYSNTKYKLLKIFFFLSFYFFFYIYLIYIFLFYLFSFFPETTSSNFIIFGWFNSDNIFISRIAVIGKPSESDILFIFFKAYIVFVFIEHPLSIFFYYVKKIFFLLYKFIFLHTLPYVPWPNSVNLK